MDQYHLWFDLRRGVKDLELADSIQTFLDHFRQLGLIEAWRLSRSKLGFRPTGLGEWHVVIETRDMAQLEAAFGTITPRAGEDEKLHAAVWSKIDGLKTGLWRDFPDANRAA